MTPPKPSAVVLRAQSDQRLVALARGGSEAAFEALVRRHRHELVVHCRRLLLSEGRAEDAVQQSLLAAWQALLAGEEVQHPRAWLHRIAHNRALDARKRSGYDHVELQASLQGGVLPQDEIERRTVVRETLAGLARLPEPQRDVLLRTAVHGDSYDQVATDLALPESTVRGMVSRARGTLRAAATAVTPGPLVAWAAAAEPAAPAAHGLAEGLSLGGSAGLAGITAKLAAATVVAGGAVAGLTSHHLAHRPAAAAAEPRPAAAVHVRAAHHRAAPAAPSLVRATPIALTTGPAASRHPATGGRGGGSVPGTGHGSKGGNVAHRQSGGDQPEHARPSGDEGSPGPTSSHGDDGPSSSSSSDGEGSRAPAGSPGTHEQAAGKQGSSGDGSGDVSSGGERSGSGDVAGRGKGKGKDDASEQPAPVSPAPASPAVAVTAPVPAPDLSGGGTSPGEGSSTEHGGRSSSPDGGGDLPAVDG